MTTSILITTNHAILTGDLDVPAQPLGMVIFAHGSGSSRFSSRNRAVASSLRESGHFGTLLFDLLTAEEDLDWSNRFDIRLLAERLLAATHAVRSQPDLAHLPIGYFGASTGAAAAIVAAAHAHDEVEAIVSRGGRPDLAGESLYRDHVPTLLIVGSEDLEVLDLNRQALATIPAHEKRLDVVQGATHLFEEPGTLEEVSRLALEWYEQWLGR